MKGQQSKMQGIEAKFKERLEGDIKTKLDGAKDAKDKYDGVSQTCESLASQIKSMAEKFEVVRTEIEQS